jgi:hypothetical protein
VRDGRTVGVSVELVEVGFEVEAAGVLVVAGDDMVLA